MINYVLSFCKITAASKIFSRNFYLPLLKPLTPKDAARTFKITGKNLLGPKRQHYIPVLRNHTEKRPEDCDDYGKMNHEIEYDYTYMMPILDPENESHRILLDILNSKNAQGMFVYTVDDKKYNLVFDATLELAIRDGEVIDVLVSQRNDKIIVKLKDFKKIPMEIDYYEGDDDLFCGEGATTAEEEKNHHHGKYTMSLAKIFEEKERLSEEWEAQLQKIIKKRKKQAGEGTIEWNEMVEEGISKLDWSKFEKEAKKVVEQLGDAIPERHIEMEVEDFELTRYVCEVILKNGFTEQLPTMKEINEVVQNMSQATPHEIEADLEENGDDIEMEPKPTAKRRVSGVMVKLPSGKDCFVTGQMVRTDDGDVFVPGQTVENEFGTEYAPGITINMDNRPTLISGLIMAEEHNEPMFLPTESSITKEGQLTFTMTPEERPKLPPERFRSKYKRNKAKQQQLQEAQQIELQNVERHHETEEAVEQKQQLEEIEDIEPPKPKKKKKKKEKQIVIVEEEQKDLDAIKTPDIQEKPLELTQTVETLENEATEETPPPENKILNQKIDDGMEELVANLELKKKQLEQKLEELRKLTYNMEDTCITYINSDDSLEISNRITEDKEKAERLSDILLTLTRRMASFRDRNCVDTKNIHNNFAKNTIMTEYDEKFDSCTNNLKVLLKTSMVAANDVFKNRPKDQLLALQAIGDLLTDALKRNPKLLKELLDLLHVSVERNEICTSIFKQLTQNVVENKMEALKSALNGTWNVLDKLQEVLEKEGDILGPAFVKLAKTDGGLLRAVQAIVAGQIEEITNDGKAVQILQKAIVKAVKEFNENNLKVMLDQSGTEEIKDFYEEAKSFGVALGVLEIVEELSHPEVHFNQNCSQPMVNFLERLTLIRKLAEKDYSLKNAIERIKKKPECARSDPRIRQLVRESAALTSDSSPIKTSREIPLTLLKTQNHLAIEDFLIQRSRIDYPILVSRKGFQAVIPKEAARGVLAGRVPYVLIDETGLTNFKPMHMFSALKLGKTREKHFENYPIIGGGGATKNDQNLELDKKTLSQRNKVRKMCKKLLNNRRQVA